MSAIFLTSANVHATGFSLGDKFETNYIYGNLTVLCRQGGRRYLRCESDVLSPAEFDYFQYDEPVKANKVILTNVIKGKKVSQSKSFNSEKGRSNSRFNLWVRTLLQTPLLGIGENTVSYELLSRAKSTAKGSIKVLVAEGPERQCPDRTIPMHSNEDCHRIDVYQYCDRYFYSENYCR
jgi:hypothetical protein